MLDLAAVDLRRLCRCRHDQQRQCHEYCRYQDASPAQ
jgi:hypothetical protein